MELEFCYTVFYMQDPLVPTPNPPAV